MNLGKIIIIMLLVLLFAFPQKAYASVDMYNLYYITFDETNEALYQKTQIAIAGKTKTEKIKSLFKLFFNNTNNYKNTYRFPDNIEIINISLYKNILTINVSKEMLNYNGGSFYENKLKDQIIKTALDIPGVNKVTLLIENDIYALKEGLVIKEATICDLTEEITRIYEK